MRVYHGTVDAFLPSIQSEGLKYTADHSFKTTSLFGGKLAIEPGVYVSTTRKGAEYIAHMKAIYLKSPKDAPMPAMSGPTWKDGDLLIPQVKPVLLTPEIPDTFKLERDSEWYDRTGRIYCGEIPASCIQKVEVLSDASAL